MTEGQSHAREVRLGLVMYGGVSLAVYINGVSNELFRAVRGRGVYKLLKELTDSDISTDVVSGTSAGGVNGVLLAFALCNACEFGVSTRIWREGADIGSLLRKPNDAHFPSLLDSEGVYEPNLEKVLERIADTPIEADGDDATTVRELDLFITGTDYNGRLSTTLDEAGHSLDVKDHRTLFWLKHREGRKQQLEPEAGGILALAKLCRITSCFPAAFTPVVVPRAPAGLPEVDGKLRVWGSLDPGQEYCFLDGGILDNKPFTSTIRTIFYRTAERPVRRHVLYVEPDPERFQSGARPRFKVPSFTQAALDSLIKLPGYESIADDLRLVAEHNDQIARLARLRAAVVSSGAPPSGPQRDLWLKARLSAFRDTLLRRLLGVESGERLSATLAERAEALRAEFDRRYSESPEASERLLDDFDVEFRLRRLFHLTYTISDEAALVVINREIELLEIVRHAMEEALSFGTQPSVPAEPGEVWKLAFWRLTDALRLDADGRPFPRPRPEEGANTALTPSDLERTRAELARRLALLTSEAVPEGNTVLGATDRYERAFASAHGSELRRAYDAFEALDGWLYPLEFVSGLHERDIIRVTRLSPIDAQRGLCARGLEEKLSGDTFAHFGAFFKRSWRANDILWGRLDGVCQLVETLAERSWLLETLANDPRQTILGCERSADPRARPGKILAWLEQHAVFPRAGSERRRAVAERLATLLDVVFTNAISEDERRAALSRHLETEWSPLVDDLVRAAHLDILDEELPTVVEDAAIEQLQWNQLATSPRAGAAPTQEELASREVAFDGASMAFTAGKYAFDPLLVALASRELATQALERLRGQDDPRALEDYFRDYRVGSESVLDAIPRVVLLELGGRAALVAENCLVESFPEPEKVRRHWLYWLCLDTPLRGFDATARFLRSAPDSQKPFVVASVLYIALAVVVNAMWFKKLYLDDGAGRQLALFLFVIAPVVVGLASWLLVRPFRSPRPRRSGSVLGWLLSLAVIALTLWASLKLLALDTSRLCASAPLASLGPHCATVLRAAALLVPITVGALLAMLGQSPGKKAT